MHTLHYYQKIPAASMWMCRIIYKVTFCLLGWSPDRGSAQHMREREQRKSPALVATGRLVNASRMLLLVDTAVFKDALVLIAHCTCCRHAGHSRVEYIQKHYLFLHAWKRGEPIRSTKSITLYSQKLALGQTCSLQLLCCADFFHAAIHTPLYAVLAVMAIIYTATFFFFGLLWWGILR